MQTFYAAVDGADFCVMRDGYEVARCETEAWSCAITDALNMIDKIAEQATEMKTWPKVRS